MFNYNFKTFVTMSLEDALQSVSRREKISEASKSFFRSLECLDSNQMLIDEATAPTVLGLNQDDRDLTAIAISHHQIVLLAFLFFQNDFGKGTWNLVRHSPDWMMNVVLDTLNYVSTQFVDKDFECRKVFLQASSELQANPALTFENAKRYLRPILIYFIKMRHQKANLASLMPAQTARLSIFRAYFEYAAKQELLASRVWQPLVRDLSGRRLIDHFLGDRSMWSDFRHIRSRGT